MGLEHLASRNLRIKHVNLPNSAASGDVLISRNEIKSTLEEVALDVVDFYQDKKPLVLVGVLNGASTVVADFGRALYDKGLRGLLHDSVKVESYGMGTKSSGVIRLTKDMDKDAAGKHLLFVDDIVDTGQTLDWLTRKYQPRAESVESFALISKPARRKIPFDPRFVGFEIEDVWVEGYGMDSAGLGRENPDIIIRLNNKL